MSDYADIGPDQTPVSQPHARAVIFRQIRRCGSSVRTLTLSPSILTPTLTVQRYAEYAFLAPFNPLSNPVWCVVGSEEWGTRTSTRGAFDYRPAAAPRLVLNQRKVPLRYFAFARRRNKKREREGTCTAAVHLLRHGVRCCSSFANVCHGVRYAVQCC